MNWVIELLVLLLAEVGSTLPWSVPPPPPQDPVPIVAPAAPERPAEDAP